MQDMVAVQRRDSAAALNAAAVVAIIDRSVHHDDGIRDAAVAESTRIIKAARVDAGHAVEILNILRERIALFAVRRGNTSHDDAGRIHHDHHIAGVSSALDRLDDDAVAVLIRVENAVHVRPAFPIFNHSRAGLDRDQRSIGRCKFHRFFHSFDLLDLLGREIEIGEKLDGARLTHGRNKYVSRRLRRALCQHEHHAVKPETDQ